MPVVPTQTNTGLPSPAQGGRQIQPIGVQAPQTPIPQPQFAGIPSLATPNLGLGNINRALQAALDREERQNLLQLKIKQREEDKADAARTAANQEALATTRDIMDQTEAQNTAALQLFQKGFTAFDATEAGAAGRVSFGESVLPQLQAFLAQNQGRIDQLTELGLQIIQDQREGRATDVTKIQSVLQNTTQTNLAGGPPVFDENGQVSPQGLAHASTKINLSNVMLTFFHGMAKAGLSANAVSKQLEEGLLRDKKKQKATIEYALGPGIGAPSTEPEGTEMAAGNFVKALVTAASSEALRFGPTNFSPLDTIEFIGREAARLSGLPNSLQNIKQTMRLIFENPGEPTGPQTTAAHQLFNQFFIPLAIAVLNGDLDIQSSLVSPTGGLDENGQPILIERAIKLPENFRPFALNLTPAEQDGIRLAIAAMGQTSAALAQSVDVLSDIDKNRVRPLLGQIKADLDKLGPNASADDALTVIQFRLSQDPDLRDAVTALTKLRRPQQLTIPRSQPQLQQPPAGFAGPPSLATPLPPPPPPTAAPAAPNATQATPAAAPVPINTAALLNRPQQPQTPGETP